MHAPWWELTVVEEVLQEGKKLEGAVGYIVEGSALCILSKQEICYYASSCIGDNDDE